MKIKEIIGREIQLYIHDKQKKYGILEDINEHGFLIKITKSEDSEYGEGKTVYIPHSNSSFTFAVVD